MALPPDRPQRRNTRLLGWDYRRPGPYAITLCTEHRWHLFGQVFDGQMMTNEAGTLVAEAWEHLAEVFPAVRFDAWVLMPNHLHALVRIPGTEVHLGDIVQGFKGLTTAHYAEGVHAGRWEPFDGRLWQRNYYDHIVRDRMDLDRCRRYIQANPANWASDIDREPDTPMVRRIHDLMRPAED